MLRGNRGLVKGCKGPLRRFEGLSRCQSKKQGQRTADAYNGDITERPEGGTKQVTCHSWETAKPAVVLGRLNLRCFLPRLVMKEG